MKQILSVMLLLLQTAAFSQDLIVTNYAGPTTFSRYEEFIPDITVKNSGIVPINDTFFVAAYLSTDDTLLLIECAMLPSTGAFR